MGGPVGTTAVASLASDRVTPLSLVDPAALLDASAPVRAGIAVVAVLLLGGLLVYRYESLLDRSMEATNERPLAAVVYGLSAHLVMLFASIYLTSRVGETGFSELNAGTVGVLFLVTLLLSAAVVGFTVVGATLVELGGGHSRVAGPLAGAGIAGGAAVLGPVYGGVVWILVVSTGIGGPVRRWVHASVDGH